MQEFVIEREIPGAGNLSEKEIRAISLRSLAAVKELRGEIKWLHSYVTDDKIYCVYMARDPEVVHRHGELAGAPVDRVSAVRRLVNPEKYAGSAG